MATSYTFSFPGSCAGLAVSVLDSEGNEVKTDTLGTSSDGDWGPVTYTVSLDVDAAGYTAQVTDEHNIVIAASPGKLDLEAAVLDLDTAEVDISDLEAAVASLTDTVADLPGPAAYVADADDTDAASVAASVDALRDALIDAGLMDGPPPPPGD